MADFLGMSSTMWTGIYTVITFGLLVVALLAALYARNQWLLTREQAEDARRAILEASRPYVLVTTEASGASQQLFDLVVKNIGQRPALSVSIALDPPPARASETPGHEIFHAKILKEPIAMIAPGQEMRAFYDSHIDRHGRDDLPTVHQVSLRYEDSSGHEYSETSVLDIEAMKGTMRASVQTIHDIGKTLQKMQETLRAASVLQRRGIVRVEASIESRAEHDQRLSEEHDEQEENVNRMLRETGFADPEEIPCDEDENRTEPIQPKPQKLIERILRWRINIDPFRHS